MFILKKNHLEFMLLGQYGQYSLSMRAQRTPKMDIFREKVCIMVFLKATGKFTQVYFTDVIENIIIIKS